MKKMLIPLLLALFTLGGVAAGWFVREHRHKAEARASKSLIDSQCALIQVSLPDRSPVKNDVATHAMKIASAANIGQLKDNPAVQGSTWFAPLKNATLADFIAALQPRVTVTPVPGTSLISIRVQMDNASDSARIANAVASTYEKNCGELSRRRVEESISLLRKDKKAKQIDLEEEVNKQLLELESTAADKPELVRGRVYQEILERSQRLRSQIDKLDEDIRLLFREMERNSVDVRLVQSALP